MRTTRFARNVVACAALGMAIATAAPTSAKDFEVWLVDQSNSAGTFGGTVHVFEGADLMGASARSATPAAVIDLGGATAALCAAQTGASPVRPHMLFFNATGSHAVLAFVASGHVVIFDAAARAPVACLRASPGAGGARQAHAAVPAADGTFVLVANQNGKLLERIDTDYGTNTFALNPAATLDLATCTTPNGVPCQLAAVRPDNAPICPIIDGASGIAFVTLRGGGLFVVDPRSTPMRIVGEYDLTAVHGNGCGGVEARGRMFIDSGGGTAANLDQFDVYAFPLAGYSPANPPNVPAPATLFSADTPNRDAHGMVATTHGEYVWVLDRAANVAEVFASATGRHVGTVQLAGPASGDPTPDLGDLAPSGNRMFVSLRGPNPLSGDPHSATGSTPGLGVIRLTHGGRAGTLIAVIRVTNVDATGVERADPHGIRVRLK